MEWEKVGKHRDISENYNNTRRNWRTQRLNGETRRNTSEKDRKPRKRRRAESRFSTFDAFPIYIEACCILCAGIKLSQKPVSNAILKKWFCSFQAVPLVYI